MSEVPQSAAVKAGITEAQIVEQYGGRKPLVVRGNIVDRTLNEVLAFEQVVCDAPEDVRTDPNKRVPELLAMLRPHLTDDHRALLEADKPSEA